MENIGVHMNWKNIKYVIFDVDGTLYGKKREYIPGRGTVQNSHEFFRYSAFSKAREEGIPDPEALANEVIQEYKEHIQNNTLLEAIASFPEEMKMHYDNLLEQYHSNGKLFTNIFDTDAGFVARLVGNTDFASILAEDKELCGLVEYLDDKYQLGIMTSEVFSTVEKVTNALAIPLSAFHMKTDTPFLVICSEVVKDKKPSLEPFEKILEITGAHPSEIVYVGDLYHSDVVPATSLGMNVIHISTDEYPEQENVIRVPSIYDVKNIL